jgi:hypothetical protein
MSACNCHNNQIKKILNEAICKIYHLSEWWLKYITFPNDDWKLNLEGNSTNTYVRNTESDYPFGIFKLFFQWISIYITNLVCYTYFHWFFSPECQHIFGKQTGYIFQSPKKIKTRVNLVTKSVINHERGKDLEVITTSGTYQIYLYLVTWLMLVKFVHHIHCIPILNFGLTMPLNVVLDFTFKLVEIRGSLMSF